MAHVLWRPHVSSPYLLHTHIRHVEPRRCPAREAHLLLLNPPPKEVALRIKRGIQADFVKLRLFDKIFFENGSYRLTPKAREALAEVAHVLKRLPEDTFIRVEGHVSELVEVKDPYVKDKWELSLRRATEVVRFLQSQEVDPRRLSAAGFGDLRPLYTWRQPILMERNNQELT